MTDEDAQFLAENGYCIVHGAMPNWVGSVRRDLLDHVILLNERHRRRSLKEYVSYQHQDRMHFGLEKDPSARRASATVPQREAHVKYLPHLAGYIIATLSPLRQYCG